MLLFLTALFGISFLVSVNVVPLVLRLAIRSGFVDRPGERKIHTRPVPYGGGIVVAISVISTLSLSMGLAFLERRAQDSGSHVWRLLSPEILHHASGAVSKLPQIAVVITGSLVILLLGLLDDRLNLSATRKFVVESIVAVAIAASGQRLDLMGDQTPGGAWLSGLVTVLWIVAITNAFNLLDHFDGLSAGVAILVSLSLVAVALQTGQVFLAAVLSIVIGACGGFLIFNFPPAKIFLGDGGSLFIGFLLASFSVSFTFYEAHYHLYSYFVPLVVLAVPAFDTLRVTLLRWRAGRPLFQGDTCHIAHRLVALGMTSRMALLTVYTLTLITGLSAVLLYQVDLSGAFILLAELILIFLLMTLLVRAGRS